MIYEELQETAKEEPFDAEKLKRSFQRIDAKVDRVWDHTLKLLACISGVLVISMGFLVYLF